jgi:hypothetical protein
MAMRGLGSCSCETKLEKKYEIPKKGDWNYGISN